MQSLHARYPFLGASRDAVEQADVDLAAVVREGGAPVDRGVERVERALVAGSVAPQTRWGTRAELLSYPVARVLVSLLDVPGAVEKYARAEATQAYERFTDDFDEDAQLKSTAEDTLGLDALLADFDLAGDVEPTGDGRFSVAVGAYLRLAAPLGDDWRLATRALHDGRVDVRRRELYDLLREAVRRRVADGLPLSVPEPIAGALSGEVERLRESLSAVESTRDVDTFAPESFPPCVQALAERGRNGELGDTGRFALLSFLASTGAPFEQVAALLGVRDLDAADDLRYQYERLAGDGAQFAPPSCETMQANDDCHDPDDLCASIGHPLAYYEKRLAGDVPADD
ncbi:DNA primase large subunit PriL [Halorarius halobius]|uniref:DNA primase large subunit PriL n=1 Tax=Halorarius halobius TaxID=2962671 RepID=UPI0020CE1E1E|nr:DNA primase large subunit PriL [Halorarius halobius]